MKGERVLNTREIKLVGQHNYTNALAALALADAVGIPRSSALIALTFTGLPHRFRWRWHVMTCAGSMIPRLLTSAVPRRR